MAVPSKYMQSVIDAAKGRPKSTEWFRDKIREFGKPTGMNLIRDGKKAANQTQERQTRHSTQFLVTSSCQKVYRLCQLVEVIFNHNAYGQEAQWHGPSPNGKAKKDLNNQQV